MEKNRSYWKLFEYPYIRELTIQRIISFYLAYWYNYSCLQIREDVIKKYGIFPDHWWRGGGHGNLFIQERIWWEMPLKHNGTRLIPSGIWCKNKNKESHYKIIENIILYNII